jgi:dolichol-phosphate mannosyltransferase
VLKLAPLKLAVVIPTLNEKGNVCSLVERLETSLGSEGWEAIFVDDNSADGTADSLRELARRDQRIRVIERIGRRGLASAAIEGMCATAAPYVALMDADHQHDPALLKDMLGAVESGEADVAVASRFLEGSSAEGLSGRGRAGGSKLANRLARRLTGTDMSDAMSGFFVIRSGQLRKQAHRLSGIGFKLLLDILATASPRLTVKEFPLQFGARREGASKLDRAVAFDFLVGLYERYFGQVIPTRYALFGTVGAFGVVVHMATLVVLFRLEAMSFPVAQTSAVIVAMSFNFWLNNWLTYGDQRLRGFRPMLRGWMGFCATCAIGALANAAVASLLEIRGMHWAAAALIGILIGSVWNYALSSKFVWGRYG